VSQPPPEPPHGTPPSGPPPPAAAYQHQAQPPVPPRARMSTPVIVLLTLAGCAGCALPIIAIGGAILFPVFAQAREAARRQSCMTNLKQLSVAILLYAQDHDEKLPLKDSWQDAIVPFGPGSVPLPFTCPSRSAVPGYAYNASLNAVFIGDLESADTRPLLFDSSLGRANASDLLQSFAPRHARKGVVAFADGSVETVAAAPPAKPGAGGE
jgi:prepilin-type processing-associated H-X9-DG protein